MRTLLNVAITCFSRNTVDPLVPRTSIESVDVDKLNRLHSECAPLQRRLGRLMRQQLETKQTNDDSKAFQNQIIP